MSEAFLTIAQTAELLGASRNRIRNLVHWGELPVVWIDHKQLIPRQAIVRFVEQNADRKRT